MAKPKFFRLVRNGFLPSFQDSIGQVPILGEPLHALQERVIRSCGADLQDVRSESEIPVGEAGFLFEEDLYFSAGFVKAAIKASQSETSRLRFCLRPNSFNERFALPDGEGFSEDPSALLRPRFSFLPAGSRSGREVECLLEQRLFRNPLAIPRALVSSGEFSYDQCSIAISRVFTPFHLLQANLAELFCATAPLREKIPNWLQKRFLRPYSRLFYSILRRQNRIGKNCLIHPTAVLEGVTLGDNVTIGANAVLRLCHIGEGSLIEDGCILKYCVLGKRNYICNANQLVSCVTYDDAFLIHGPYQFSIFGREAVVMAVLNCDVRLDNKCIAIPTPAGLLDSRQPLLGIAYGHESKVGAGTSIAPGRIVPNGQRINPPNIILKFEAATRPLVDNHPGL